MTYSKMIYGIDYCNINKQRFHGIKAIGSNDVKDYNRMKRDMMTQL